MIKASSDLPDVYGKVEKLRLFLETHMWASFLRGDSLSMEEGILEEGCVQEEIIVIMSYIENHDFTYCLLRLSRYIIFNARYVFRKKIDQQS